MATKLGKVVSYYKGLPCIISNVNEVIRAILDDFY